MLSLGTDRIPLDGPPVKKPAFHKFHRLEILGDKVKKLTSPEDFFIKLFKDACMNIEEIIIDGILKKTQL